ncbi:hypothetical protein DPQ33_16305 [Oceanidesulfovibrio indonesiensis]|uniref:ParB/Sulfiredoxin domain-containing protein n=1 Tax=Oceanidesulfovibrio indonesiensis TaxID=54767 RepID=A0A7M3MAW5_9BACT|nr:hypothetical protein [Oceanidesulfovibrio indonesiensis]TVM15049.1 hypothetical protein DPQ33_16305 [Oceanidesulfovibrio indonesiensis]
MIDYSNWELRKLSVDALILDRENPRLPEEMLHQTQKAIIHFLVDQFKVLELAKSMALNGFFINETPIVAKVGKKFVVVEGNRRITALKLLRNPALAPPRKKHSYVRLSENIDTSQWDKLPVYIAPSKEEVAPILVARHGSEMTSPWQRIMKMRFLAGEVLRGVDHETIAEKFSVSISEVRTAAITILLREMIREADIPDAMKDSYLHEKFQTSTLARIFEAKRFQELAGLKLIGAKLTHTIPQDEFLEIILHLCKLIVEGELTARTHNSKEERDKFIEDVFNKFASGESGEYEFEAPAPRDEGEKKEPRKPRPRSKKERLIPETMSFNTGMQKLNELLVEGHKMSVGSYPHAGGLLLRTILDLSIQRLYEINDKLDETKHNDGRTIGLTKRINLLTSNHADWFPDRATCQKFQRFTARDSESFIHIETLNDYAHGDYGKPTKDDLRNFWEQIEPILDLLLED